MPIFSPTHSTIVIKITATVLFLISPIEVIVGAIPMFARATASIENINKLEASLDEMLQHSPQAGTLNAENTVEDESTFAHFKQLQFENINFQYTDKTGMPTFKVGPIDLTIQREEILFIIGGNGSGKSTFLKLLTGLYYPLSGSISVDGEEIDRSNYQAHRELFSIIFTDFHLFDRLYGLQNVDEKRVKALLQMMELQKKTKYINGQFSQLDLSTGQKKRLAFVAAVMEDKPIYIFDELAADQDPQFRKHFYEEILPDLRRQGKTIIAVTHDDAYFHCADRVMKMESGQLIPYNASRWKKDWNTVNNKLDPVSVAENLPHSNLLGTVEKFNSSMIKFHGFLSDYKSDNYFAWKTSRLWVTVSFLRP